MSKNYYLTTAVKYFGGKADLVFNNTLETVRKETDRFLLRDRLKVKLKAIHRWLSCHGSIKEPKHAAKTQQQNVILLIFDFARS